MPRTSWFQLLAMIVTTVVLTTGAVRAVLPDEVLSDPTLETRARALSRELRCMVCQNQSIDDSEAPLARDLRVLVRDRLKAGDSDREVLNFLTARYGAFVLLKPPLEWTTSLLWFGPPGLLIVGAVALMVAARRRAAASLGVDGDALRLTPAEEARVAVLLSETTHERLDKEAGDRVFSPPHSFGHVSLPRSDN
jgi:cytochrome c-type biogenesis protein CcmH